MIKTKNILIACILFILFGCRNSNKEIYIELERFDNSLDSLIEEKTFDYTKYFIFNGDTLKNSPKQIEEIYYQKINNDSLKVDANCHIYKFENNQLVINSSENFLGQKYVQKYIYFQDKIDNYLIQTLRAKNRNTDTIIFGCLKKYNADGSLIKSITSSVWKEVDKNTGSWKINDNRMLEVYTYNFEKGFYTTFRKEYFNKKYNIDSLRIINVKQFDTELGRKNIDIFQYSYIYDDYGNWTVKRRINNEYPEVYYRKITY